MARMEAVEAAGKELEKILEEHRKIYEGIEAGEALR